MKCVECESERNLIPVFRKGTINGCEEDYSKKMICKECAEESEDYGLCLLCSEEAAYHSEDLIDGYCKEHYDEVQPSDEEEEEDMDSFSEYHADPSHW